MFSLSFVEGSKSAEGGPNPLADLDWGGSISPSGFKWGWSISASGGSKSRGSKSARTLREPSPYKKKQVLSFFGIFLLAELVCKYDELNIYTKKIHVMGTST